MDLQTAHPSFADIWYSSYRFSMLALTIGLIGVIPYADSLAVDRDEGTIYYLSFRNSYKKYLFSKFLINALMSFFTVFVSLALFYLICNLIAPRNIFIHGTWLCYGYSPAYGLLEELYKNSPDIFILITSSLASLMAALYATLGMAIGLISKNRYLPWALPVAIYLGSHFISYKTRTLGPEWSPVNAVNGYSYLYLSEIYLHPLAMFCLIFLILTLFRERSKILG